MYARTDAVPTTLAGSDRKFALLVGPLTRGPRGAAPLVCLA